MRINDYGTTGDRFAMLLSKCDKATMQRKCNVIIKVLFNDNTSMCARAGKIDRQAGRQTASIGQTHKQKLPDNRSEN